MIQILNRDLYGRNSRVNNLTFFPLPHVNRTDQDVMRCELSYILTLVERDSDLINYRKL